MTDQTEAPERRVTFRNETPETSDVVLCNYCGESLHDVEQGIFWEQTMHHYCETAKDKRIEELEAKLANAARNLKWLDSELKEHGYFAQGKLRSRCRATLAELKGTEQ